MKRTGAAQVGDGGAVVSKLPKHIIMDTQIMSSREVIQAVIKAQRRGLLHCGLEAAYIELPKYVRQEYERDRKSITVERKRVGISLQELSLLMSRFMDLHPQEFALYELGRVELSRLCAMRYPDSDLDYEEDKSKWEALELHMEETHQLVKAALVGEATTRSRQVTDALFAASSCPHTTIDQEIRDLLKASREAVQAAMGECAVVDAAMLWQEAPYPHSECVAHEALAGALESARVSAHLLERDCDEIRSIWKYLCDNTRLLRAAEDSSRASRFFFSFYKD